jgi:hypothetical protein
MRNVSQSGQLELGKLVNPLGLISMDNLLRMNGNQRLKRRS